MRQDLSNMGPLDNEDDDHDHDHDHDDDHSVSACIGCFFYYSSLASFVRMYVNLITVAVTACQ